MQQVRPYLPLVSLATIAALSTIAMYHQGVGLSTDTIAYFAYAQTLAFADLPVHHGVLYALFVGLFAATGLAVPVAAATVNVIAAFVAGAALSGILTRVFNARPAWAPWAAGLLTLFSLAWLDSFAYAMSEPLFYATLLAATYFLLMALDQPARAPALWYSAGFAALATLTRYAGLSFVAIFCFVIWWAHAFRGRGFKYALAYGAIAMLPLTVLMIWNHLYHGTTTNRQLLWTAIPSHYLAEGTMNIASWFVPFKLLLQWPWLHVALTLAFLLAVAGITAQAAFTRHRPLLLCGLATLGYTLFYLLVSVTVDLGAFNQRKLSPVFIFGFMTLIGWLYPAVALHRRRLVRLAGAVMALYMILFTGYRAAGYIHESYRDGRGFAARHWEEGILLQAVHYFRSQTPIYSNADDAYFLRTGQSIRRIPWRFIRTTTIELESFPAEYERMRHAFLAEGAVLWRSHLRYWPPYLTPADDIIEAFDLAPFHEAPTGSLYAHTSKVEIYADRLAAITSAPSH